VDATEFAKNGEHPGGDEIWGSYQHGHDRNLDATKVFHKRVYFNLQVCPPLRRFQRHSLERLGLRRSATLRLAIR
jgi:hypothetical protein